MSLKVIITTFLAIFLAELGDKTQLAVLTLSAESKKPVSVFIGAIVAFGLITLLGAFLGGVITKFVPEHVIEKIAAIAFIVIGILMFFEKI
ncbi:MAG: TMEM165/GDT1 family protein [Candidatus Kryptonium sp.]|nr:TMEM165/GDT1 family protein [Candidatus Kryptonium sp.]MCX7762377.1 TMEM165/GDT1 family protein [Candidatus Kryptonium sp.]MDW8109701.1 TMEM165/GDT1 family protein [Candidatus Kryptonium sp.]